MHLFLLYNTLKWKYKHESTNIWVREFMGTIADLSNLQALDWQTNSFEIKH